MIALVSIDSVINLLRSGIPDVEWLLSRIESEQGWLRFPTLFTNLITNLKIDDYPLIYTSENLIAAVFFKAFLTNQEIKELNEELESASPEARGQFIEGLTKAIDDILDSPVIPKTPRELVLARKQFRILTPNEQQEAIQSAKLFWASYLAYFYQNLSTMIHGEKLTSLVNQAESGNDDAFVKAVQVDHRILLARPYFRNRFAAAQDESDSDFYDLLSYRLRVPPYRGKIRHKGLWLAFSVLQQAGLLDTLKHWEILEICDEAGIGGDKYRIASEKHLSSRLAEYREFQKRGIVTTN